MEKEEYFMSCSSWGLYPITYICGGSGGAGIRNGSEEGIKLDDGKPQMDLLDSEFLEGLSRVLSFGAKKYSAHNWRKGIHVSRLVAAAYRHLGAINRNEDIDSETGLPHVHHLACCVMFLSWMLQHRPDLDDRYSSKKE
jgi:hypothetical protein